MLWLVEGCLEYQREGLRIPDCVTSETADYRKENDGIGRFLSERCVQDPAFSTPCKKMEDSIKEFCKEEKCEIPNRNEISNYLKKIYTKKVANSGNFWIGVSIHPENSGN